MSYSSHEFCQILRDCYFHPDNLKNYPSEMTMQKTRAALILLWNLEHLQICGMRYDRDFIRHLLIDEMMPEDVTRAISYYVHRVKKKAIPSLSVTIFLSVLLSEVITDMEFSCHEYGELPFESCVTVTVELIA